jgi:hypothetical protein
LGKSRAKRSRKAPDGRPQKLSPTLAGNKRRANREKKFSGPKSTATRPNAQGPERSNVGFIEQIGEIYKAIGDDERELGTFNSLKAAADAVSASFNQGSCPEPCSGGAA